MIQISKDKMKKITIIKDVKYCKHIKITITINQTKDEQALVISYYVKKKKEKEF